ncbi:MAG: aldehyde dehydrogenase family protein [Lachnospiraceae bacterium]|nr:aldehyde dehydrogenase family protein [Lachnospiraceae bacterium]
MLETKLYYDGEWNSASSTRPTYNPATGEVIAYVAEADEKDTEKAIASARRAFDEGEWPHWPAAKRAAVMNKAAELFLRDAEKLWRAEADNAGKLYNQSVDDPTDIASIFRYFAGIATLPSGQTFNSREDIFVMNVREPIGVTAAIVPWNYPLFITAASIAPALAAGNTVVIKPASVTPLSTVYMVELMEEAGFPKGVVNLVTGSGSVVGDVISKSPDVDQIVFTGGTDTGRRIMSLGACNVKRLELEMGGKSPIVMFADYDKEIAADNMLMGMFCNNGQLCTASTRLIIEDSIYEDMIEILKEKTEKLTLGTGDDNADISSLVSPEHMQKVLAYIEKGKEEGARLVCGGYRETEGKFAKGCYVRPTLFADVTEDMTIAKEEIFGPVIVIQKFSTVDEAIRIANATQYGLAGGVFTNDMQKAQKVIRRMRSGIIWVNTYLQGISDCPAGGLKQSGLGVLSGLRGLEAFTESKRVNIRMTPGKFGMFNV